MEAHGRSERDMVSIIQFSRPTSRFFSNQCSRGHLIIGRPRSLRNKTRKQVRTIGLLKFDCALVNILCLLYSCLQLSRNARSILHKSSSSRCTSLVPPFASKSGLLWSSKQPVARTIIHTSILACWLLLPSEGGRQ
jgi:hypothetical protein